MLAIALTLWAVTAACGDEDRPTETNADRGAASPPPSGPLVIFLGDSIANGLHLSKEEAFPSVIRRRLAAKGVDFRLVIAGGSGLTTAGGAGRMAWLLAQNPAILVVELGANDGLRGISLDAVERNLTSILDAARSASVPVLLLGVRLPPNYGEEYAGGFDALYGRLAERDDVDFVPYFMEGVGGVPELNLPDGIHPTAEGHERLAENVLPDLERLLNDL